MRKFLTLVMLAAVVSVSALAGASLFPGTSAAQPGTLYAVDGAGTQSGCGGNLSNLYTMNPSTGAATLVGPIMINSTQIKHVTGIAVHPSSGALYGVMNGQQTNCSDFALSTLLSINTSTAAATVIGSLGSLGHQIPDIDFDPFGQLYGWAESAASGPVQDDLIAIDITNGTAAAVGECSCSTSATGLAIKSTGAMYMKNANFLNRMNHGIGTIITTLALDMTPQNLLAFDPSDVLFTGTRNRTAGTFTLQTINHTTGAVSDVGTTSVSHLISAIAFDRTALTPPLAADLSLTKTVSPAPASPGQQVVFTLSLNNAGPDDATGVVVSDPLPSGYSYVSDDGGGAYNSGSGDWTVGTVVDTGSETLMITATVLADGDHLNSAEVSAANEFDPDSIPGSNMPGEDDQDAADATADGAVEVIVRGKIRAGAAKRFVVRITNAGTAGLPVNNSLLGVTITVNGSANFDGTCVSFSKVLKPGRSTRVRCSFNVIVSPGASLEYAAILTVPGDFNPANDSDSVTKIAQ